MPVKHKKKKILGITSLDDKLGKKVTAEIFVSVSTSREVVLFIYFFSPSIPFYSLALDELYLLTQINC